MNEPIPVMGVPIVNGVHWLRRMIASIDYPVGELVIINNNGRGQIDSELDEIVKEPHAFVSRMRVVHMPSNLGVPGSWNLIIKSYLMAPYWFLVSHDIEFGPGLIEEMVNKAKVPHIGMVHVRLSERGFGCYSAFILKDFIVAKHGLFDENFYPAYAEDIEYIIRTYGIWWDFGTIPFKHGDTEYAESGSQTWRTEINLRDKLSNSRILNECEYLPRRWGSEWHTYKGKDMGHIPFDLAFCRRKYMGF